ncbi:TrmH family RNA methyltransferase [Rarobacter incanus]|nr:RNA methyltransferase [Rarobacter incanus]
MTSLNLIRLDELSRDSWPDLSDYFDLTDVQLRKKLEPEHGLFIAESSAVIRRAIAAGNKVRSILMAHRWVESMSDVIAGLDPGTPVYIADEPTLESLVGFHLHRGAIASMHRPQLPDAAQLLERTCPPGSPARIAVFENMVDHTNLGAAFRSAAALGVDAVLVTPDCSDPLYRRSVRVSMGAVFQVPWTRIYNWPQAGRSKREAGHSSEKIGGLELLRSLGFESVAMALTDHSVSLDDYVRQMPKRVAIVLGTEGAGLGPRTIAEADAVVRIPMFHNVDSLNVAAAAAVMFWATRRQA